MSAGDADFLGHADIFTTSRDDLLIRERWFDAVASMPVLQEPGVHDLK